MGQMLDLIKGISQEPHNKHTVIMGKPGSGKTTLAGTYPKPILYVSIETDGGGEVLQGYSDDEIKYINVSSDTVGTPNAKHVQTKMMELLNELLTNKHPFKTVIVDAYSSIEESVISYMEKVKGSKLNLQERGSIGTLMLDLRNKGIDLARTDVEYVTVCHIKDKETTDNATGETSTMIIPKMSYNNGNILLERAFNVMYCSKRTIVNPDGTRRVGFLTYIGAHPNLDTKLRTKEKLLSGGTYIENLTYDKLQEIINGQQKIENLEKINVVENQKGNPFDEDDKKDEGEW